MGNHGQFCRYASNMVSLYATKKQVHVCKTRYFLLCKIVVGRARLSLPCRLGGRTPPLLVFKCCCLQCLPPIIKLERRAVPPANTNAIPILDYLAGTGRKHSSVNILILLFLIGILMWLFLIGILILLSLIIGVD
jgi:hypothetical protein